MTKLAMCCGNLMAGGAERVISILANKFAAKEITVYLYTWYKTDLFYSFDDRVIIIQIPIESGSSTYVNQMRWFRNSIKLIQPDVVLSFLAPFNMLSVFSLAGLKTPVLVAERNDPYFVSPAHNWFWKIIRNFAYEMADGVLVQTKVNKSHFPWYIQRKASIIYNPVTFSQDIIGIALKQEKRKEIVSVTRLETQKNVSMLIDAFARFKQKHPDYILTIYGEGEERMKLEKKVLELNLEDAVFLPGRKKDVHKKIVGAEVFAMASNFEGMSNSLIEAMCLGLPCISTKVSGATELIEEGINGILVDVGDTEGMCRALCEMVNNKETAYMIGKNASELYEKLNVDVVAGQWLNYIESYVG